MATESSRSDLPWELRQKAAAVEGELAAYEAYVVLQCSRVAAGGPVSSVTHAHLPSMCRRYLALRPRAERDVLELVTAHRVLFGELLRYRSGMRDEGLPQAKRRHSAVLRTLVDRLRASERR